MDRKKMRAKRSKKTQELLAAGAEFEDIVRCRVKNIINPIIVTITITLPMITIPGKRWVGYQRQKVWRSGGGRGKTQGRTPLFVPGG